MYDYYQQMNSRDEKILKHFCTFAYTLGNKLKYINFHTDSFVLVVVVVVIAATGLPTLYNPFRVMSAVTVFDFEFKFFLSVINSNIPDGFFLEWSLYFRKN